MRHEKAAGGRGAPGSYLDKALGSVPWTPGALHLGLPSSRVASSLSSRHFSAHSLVLEA